MSGSVHEGEYAGRLARKYGMDVAQAQQMLDSMTAAAAAEGLDFHFERAVRANTARRPPAHSPGRASRRAGRHEGAPAARVLHRRRGRRRSGSPRRTCGDAGLDEAEARAALEGQTYLGAVRRDEQEAVAFGISGVPFFVIDRKYGVSGAQPPAALLQVLEQAWAESHPIPTLLTVGADGADADGLRAGRLSGLTGVQPGTH